MDLLKKIKIIKNGGVTTPSGFSANGIHCGLKRNGKEDLCLIFSETAATSAGVFTTNKVKAAPVTICQKQLKHNKIRAVIINSGNANACTGKNGLDDAWKMVKATAKVLNIEAKEVLVASTGRIGIKLPVEKVINGINKLKDVISKDGGHNSALAIMTTDLYPKEMALEFIIDKKKVRLGGICKGAGMIHPNMATMLCFLTCDINIEKKLLKKILEEAVNNSFNLITVDGDRSTNDTAVILANGMAGNGSIKEGSSDHEVLSGAVSFICRFFAKEIVRNGEGATKLVKINVVGSKTKVEAKKAAFAVANSSLVKTAIFGKDPNWGRVMSAVGTSGINIVEEKIDIYYGKNKIVAGGVGIEKVYPIVKKYLLGREIELTIDLNQGKEQVSVLTCDLTPEYVKINAGKS
ncbi:MAG: bifunctional glutamate N-acetyltransferase/amino-acid acetyltransferase ArgJ [bacterium]|nr:bifunctional glutamate N-acetyltransferase/amino-acid acetyltransferase ArgJ [bacterium]